VTLPEIREHKALQEMVLINRSRLSVQPVTEKEFKIISELGGSKAR
jgi:predicted RNA-binding protein with PUA-like domain